MIIAWLFAYLSVGIMIAIALNAKKYVVLEKPGEWQLFVFAWPIILGVIVWILIFE